MSNVVPAERPSYRSVPIQARDGGGMLMPQTFGEVVSFSEIMARSQHAIPKHLRDVPGACLAVAMQAMRWAMDPFAVASKSYNVKDIIAYEAQLIAAVVHTRAPLKTRPNYVYTGEGADRRCKVSALFDDGIERSYESPRIVDITVKNSPLWKADPDQQLGYYSIRAFARRYCPEVVMGVYTPEEAETFRGPEQARDVTPRAPLAERLAAAQPAADGFSQQHVISEIDGGAPAAQAETPSPQAPPPSSEDKPAPDDQVQASSGAGDPPSPLTTVGTGPLGGDARQDDEQKPGNTAEERSSLLPEGWATQYAAALKRASKPLQLQKRAAEFWAPLGGWIAHKDGPDAETAKAIYDACERYFANHTERDAILHELGADQ